MRQRTLLTKLQVTLSCQTARHSKQRNNCVKHYDHKHIFTIMLKRCVLNAGKCPIYLAEQGDPLQTIHTSGTWKAKAGKEDPCSYRVLVGYEWCCQKQPHQWAQPCRALGDEPREGCPPNAPLENASIMRTDLCFYLEGWQPDGPS